jgi:hypothetical protein
MNQARTMTDAEIRDLVDSRGPGCLAMVFFVAIVTLCVWLAISYSAWIMVRTNRIEKKLNLAPCPFLFAPPDHDKPYCPDGFGLDTK